MNMKVHIERVVLEGLPVGAHDGAVCVLPSRRNWNISSEHKASPPTCVPEALFPRFARHQCTWVSEPALAVSASKSRAQYTEAWATHDEGQSSVSAQKAATTKGRAPAGCCNVSARCGQHTHGEGECQTCSAGALDLQRYGKGAPDVHPIANSALTRSSGPQLNAPPRRSSGAKFDRDFSSIPVHADASDFVSGRGGSLSAGETRSRAF